MYSPRLFTFVLASILVVPTLCATFTSVSQLPTLKYDYVIVGAGTAGLVLANRLTENSNIQVLVLEAGVSDAGVIPAIAPFLGPTLTPSMQSCTPFDWNYTVVAQTGLNGRTFPYPRGRLLGGSSSANYMFHQYGASGDYDRLSTVTGDTGFKWTNMRQYIQKHEKIVPPTDGHDTTGQFIPSLHGFSGEVSVSLPGNSQGIDARVIATTSQLKSEFPLNHDMSGGDQPLLGVGWVQSSVGGGVRSSSSTSYLANGNSRPNLHVLINATVMKLIQSGTKGGLPSFRSVQFTSSPGTASTPAGNAPTTVTATNEVILSAGSLGTAQILLLSGIGPKADLQALNIKSLVDNPSVGSNLSDHTFLPNIFNVKAGESFDPMLRDSSLIGAAINQWATNHTGVISNNVANNFGFQRLASNSTIFKTVKDPASAPTSPHWEIIFSNFWINPGIALPATGNFMTVVTTLISPTSRGTVKLRSTNAFDKPIIDPKFLTSAFDIFTMRESVKAVKRFVAASAWSSYVVSPFGALASTTTDDAIDAYVRGLSTTIFHPVGTAAMTSTSAKYGVVNPDFTVKGTDGLRIVDASIFPFIPSGHTQGPTYLIAERAADIIKACKGH
ncbi:aryl-alcohol oxidase [Crassisporium funariophilum]|nr:aryl-alcohol oxidase [Crassisporium funariophilum]